MGDLEEVMKLATTLMGLELKNPIVVGSSGLTDDAGKVKELEEKGAAAVVLRSIFEEEIISEYDDLVTEATSKGYSQEFYDYYDYQIRSDRLTQYAQLILRAKKSVSIPVIASVNCVYSHEWASYAHELEDAGADALELNMFSLPAAAATDSHAGGSDLFFEVIEQVRAKISIPLSVKISYYFSDLSATIKRISNLGVDALVLFNRSFHPDFNINDMRVMPTYVLSSPQDGALPLRWIANTAGDVDCDLVASTGVHDGATVVKQLLAGAHAVQVVSALYKNGSDHIGAMLSEVEEWMIAHEYESVDAFRGKLSQSQEGSSMVRERVEFMKHFGATR